MSTLPKSRLLLKRIRGCGNILYILYNGSHLLLAILTVIAAATVTSAENSFVAKTLGSNMVLQRDATPAIYGYSSAAGSNVTVSFNSKDYVTSAANTASTDGGYYWKVELPSVAGGFNAYSIDIKSSANEAQILDNVVFGDVFLCGGQSNMQFAVPGDFDHRSIIAEAHSYNFIRVFTTGQDYNLPVTLVPLDDLQSFIQPWQVGSSLSAGLGQDWAVYFSAVCWLFGKNVYDGPLEKSVPVGLVSNNWGGTFIEAWSPPEVMASCGIAAEQQQQPSSKKVDPWGDAALQRAREERGDAAFDPNANSALYNTMIYPFRDMAIKGAIWYQGESNVAYHAEQYPCMQDGMVKAWRNLMHNNFPLIYTQISTWDNGGGNVVANFRNLQFSITGITDNVAMISAADLGDPESPYDPIHPRNKTEVGRRMGLAARSLIYNTPVPHMGPLFESISVFEDELFGQSVRVTFEASTVGEGLHLEAPQECAASSQMEKNGCGEVILVYPSNSKVLQSDERVLATVIISGPNTVDFIPTKRQSSTASSLEYCLGDYPLMVIYNSYGVPAIPFVVSTNA